MSANTKNKNELTKYFLPRQILLNIYTTFKKNMWLHFQQYNLNKERPITVIFCTFITRQ